MVALWTITAGPFGLADANGRSSIPLSPEWSFPVPSVEASPLPSSRESDRRNFWILSKQPVAIVKVGMDCRSSYAGPVTKEIRASDVKAWTVLNRLDPFDVD
jgi:hypothetical protein